MFLVLIEALMNIDYENILNEHITINIIEEITINNTPTTKYSNSTIYIIYQYR